MPTITKIFYDYITWHYTVGLFRIFHLWKNFSWFIINLFSIPQLTKHLFAPFKRASEERSKKFDIEDMLGTFLVNLLFRFVGFFMRSIIIVLGLLSLVANITITIITYVIWFLAPLLIPGLMLGGLFLMLSGW